MLKRFIRWIYGDARNPKSLPLDNEVVVIREWYLCTLGNSCCGRGHERIRVSLTKAEIDRILSREENEHLAAYLYASDRFKKVSKG